MTYVNAQDFGYNLDLTGIPLREGEVIVRPGDVVLPGDVFVSWYDKTRKHFDEGYLRRVISASWSMVVRDTTLPRYSCGCLKTSLGESVHQAFCGQRRP